ncbi:MAG: hypothetical protein GDA56_07600 [Hormoscilla sp. GM7CHS1pb]|nr:hypothetical protein [Hormoscilla sp. GM7CHS1pb]
MAIVAVGNLTLVAFDMSYVRMRNFWLQGNIPIPIVGGTIKAPVPPVTSWYDPVKGIEPHRDTAAYLQRVDALEAQIRKTGVRSPSSEALLEELRVRSVKMIEENPFQVANKSGTLEKIKNRMRDLIDNEQDSSKEAFKTFWSQEYLATASPAQGLGFFEEEIRPPIETNYFRSSDETGEFTDKFWQLDLPFAILFILEFLARTFYISRQYTSIGWQEAMLWRWYDIFLFLPFFRWLRVIPVTIRLNDAELIDLEPVRAQFSRGFVASFAGELTEVAIVQTINQVQKSVKSGDLARQVFESVNRPYIDLNNINEAEAISGRLVQLTLYEVLPEIEPDLRAWLNHNIESILSQSPVYQGLHALPGLNQLPAQLTLQIATQVSKLLTEGSQSLYDAIINDPVGGELTNKLVQHFGQALGSEIQQKQNLQELESLIYDFLEEVKINYVQHLSQEDIEQILEQTRQLQQGSKS